MEAAIISLDDRYSPIDPTTFDIAGSKIFAQYLHHDCYLPQDYIVKHAAKLTMPVWMVQGRYDMDAPPATAYELKKKMPNSHLIWTIGNHRVDHETDMVIRTILLNLAEKS